MYADGRTNIYARDSGGVLTDWDGTHFILPTHKHFYRADPRMAGGGVQRLAKSRYDAISCYIYSCQSDMAQPPQQQGPPPSFPPTVTPRSASASASGGGMWGGGDEVLNAYNDVAVEVDEGLEALMLERGVDSILARHVVRTLRCCASYCSLCDSMT